MDEVRLFGESDKLKNQIVDLGTRFSLVTDYTSMVVLDDQEMESMGIQRHNAQRVAKERAAQQQRQQAPVKNYRVDNNQKSPTFKGNSSPGIGSGPVGPWFLVVLLGCGWLVRRKQSS